MGFVQSESSGIAGIFVLPNETTRRIRQYIPFILTQVVVQLISFTAAILLVQNLEQRQYAYFTIAFSLLNVMNLLADMGITSALFSIGGRVWNDSSRLAQLIKTAIHFRRFLGVIVALVVTPILVAMLMTHGAGISYALFLSGAVLLGFFFQLKIHILYTIPRLYSDIRQIQFLDLVFVIFRLSFLCLAYFIFLDSIVAILVSAASFGLQLFLLNCWTLRRVDWKKATLNVADAVEMTGIVKSQIASTLFYCLQGQIAVWMISVFGTTQKIAEIGALSRLSALFSLVFIFMLNVISPAYARIRSAHFLRQRYFQILVIFGLLMTGLVSTALFFPEIFLWILGSQYSHLRQEVLLIVGNSAAYSFCEVLSFLNASRAWVKGGWLIIPSTLLVQIAALSFFDLSSIRGAILFGSISVIPAIAVNLGMAFRGFRNEKGLCV